MQGCIFIEGETGQCPNKEMDLGLNHKTPFFTTLFPIKESRQNIGSQGEEKKLFIGNFEKGDDLL